MDPERWHKIDELLQSALQRPASEREAFLAEACQGDPELEQELRSLLEAQAKAGEFLENPAAEAVARALAEDGSTSLVGQTISHYRILEKLGGGGMGVVYKAEDTRLHRFVALKFLGDDLAGNPQALERLRREAQAASALNHPHICTIYDIGEADSHVFIAMEYLEGETLAQRIGGKPLPTCAVLGLAVQIADALEAAHQKGIIHRDIKPANIFVTRREDAKILDFGLAKLTENGAARAESAETIATGDGKPGEQTLADGTGAGHLTRTGITMGTIAYMSPEQARGEPLDARTDLFSFGATLHEMATGQRAFSGSTPAVIFHAVLGNTPKPAPELNPAVPAKLQAIISKARRMRYLVPAAVVLAIAVIGGAFLLRRNQEPKPFPMPRQITSNSEEVPIWKSLISPDGKSLAYYDLSGLHIRSISSGQETTFPRPAEIAQGEVWQPQTWFPDGNKILFGHVAANLESFSAWTVAVNSGVAVKIRDNAWPLDMSPNGLLIAFCNADCKEIWVMGPRGEAPRRIAAAERDFYWAGYGVRWSPDSKSLAAAAISQTKHYAFATSLVDIDVNSGRSRPLVNNPEKWLDFRWLSDWRIIFSAPDVDPSRSDANLWEVPINPKTRAPAGKPRQITRWARTKIDDISVSQDGKRLAFDNGLRRNSIFVARLTSTGLAAPPRKLTFDENDNLAWAWSADSKYIYFTSNRSTTWSVFRQAVRSDPNQLLPADPGQPIVIGPVPKGQDSGPLRSLPLRVTPDGAFLMYFDPTHPSNPYDGLRDLKLAPVAGGPRTTLMSSAYFTNVSCPQRPARACLLSIWDARKGRLVFSSVDANTRQHRKLFELKNDYTWMISPNGNEIATIARDRNAIDIYSLQGTLRRSLSLSGWTPLLVDWAADAKSLLLSASKQSGFALLRAYFNGSTQVLWNFQNFETWALAKPIPSPDGQSLAIQNTTGDRNAWIVDLP